jgi:hypothetical protein
MPASFRSLILALPALGALGGCGIFGFGSSPPPVPPATPPAPALNGALGAPAPGTPVQAFSGSSVAPSVAPSAPMPLSAADALALLANNTAIGLTNAGVPYLVYFSNDGAARFREETLADSGTWRVLPDGELCSKLPNISNGAETCYRLARYGDVLIYERPNGPALGSIRVVAGNPQNL